MTSELELAERLIACPAYRRSKSGCHDCTYPRGCPCSSARTRIANSGKAISASIASHAASASRTFVLSLHLVVPGCNTSQSLLQPYIRCHSTGVHVNGVVPKSCTTQLANSHSFIETTTRASVGAFDDLYSRVGHRVYCSGLYSSYIRSQIRCPAERGTDLSVHQAPGDPAPRAH